MPRLLHQHDNTSTEIKIVKNSKPLCAKFMTSQMLLQVLRSLKETTLELLTNNSLGNCSNIIKKWSNEAMSTCSFNHSWIKPSRVFFNAQGIHTKFTSWNKNALESLECDHQARNIRDSMAVVGPHLASSSPKCERGLHPRSFWQSNSEPRQMGLITVRNIAIKQINMQPWYASWYPELYSNLREWTYYANTSYPKKCIKVAENRGYC